MADPRRPVLVYLDKADRKALEALAEREGRTVSGQGRYIITQYLKST